MLLGPAGSGKTFRCLAEIREELAQRPEGPALVFIAPRQATFQLERQLLGDAGLEGYSRLRILSFQRLARYVFEACEEPLPKLLSAEGKVMVLRALLGELHDRFDVYKPSVRRIGFAEEAGEQIREFQQHGLTPEKLRGLAANLPLPARDKLRDLALLYETYNAWLAANGLHDEEWLLTLAAELLDKNGGRLRLGGLWFDGFAQLTPQERTLLRAVVAETPRAALAFCLDKPVANSFSQWHLVSQMYARCRAELETRFGKEAIQVEYLERSGSGFDPALGHLEKCWSGGPAFHGPSASIRLMECAEAEMEVTACAREITRFVRAGGRYREAAVLVRDFTNDYPHLFRRTFSRYGIPFFLDHRESVAHHPLAEVTRGAVRMSLFNWKHQDCFAVFKSGLLPIAFEALDELENESLEHGWEGAAWREGFRLPRNSAREAELNRWRARLVEPFLRFSMRLKERSSGAELAEAIRELWAGLNAGEQLEEWGREATAAVHQTVWEQMNSWLENLDLAFARQKLPLREWLPIIEAGLNGLSVGVIPPVLDQVLIGTVDRSRNPDLKVIFVLGLNEGVFPAVPPRKPLLTESDRETLLACGCELSNVPAQQIAREQFYGYIACTRARQQVVLSWARTTSDGNALNPSRFIGQVQRLFPALKIEQARKPSSLDEVEHFCELGGMAAAALLPERLRAKAFILSEPQKNERLDPLLVRRLYGTELKVSVSAMERFAMCPFRFYVEQGLRVRERMEFTLDVREQGSFQHAVLARFHQETRSAGKQWREWSVDEARQLVGRIADEEMVTFRDGMLLANEANRFTGENYKSALQDFIALVVRWFAANQFNPAAVELPFGQKDEDSLPGWTLPLANGCTLVLGGRVDRVDVHRTADGRAACIVMDYKSGDLAPNRTLLHHGIQQQLPAYLLAMTRLPEASGRFGVTDLAAAGCFYVPLGAKEKSESTRLEVLENLREKRGTAHRHSGIFDFSWLPQLDSEFEGEKSGQFNYSLTSKGKPNQSAFAALPAGEFQQLLERMETNLLDFGRRIYEGEISIHPYKKGSETACAKCHHLPICRFDPWTQRHNDLRKAARPEEAEAAP